MKKKIKLNDLKVQSFITAVNPVEIKGASNVIGGGVCVGVTAVDCRSVGVLSPCLTGIYPTLPVIDCVQQGSNGHNCPTEAGPLC